MCVVHYSSTIVSPPFSQSGITISIFGSILVLSPIASAFNLLYTFPLHLSSNPSQYQPKLITPKATVNLQKGDIERNAHVPTYAVQNVPNQLGRLPTYAVQSVPHQLGDIMMEEVHLWIRRSRNHRGWPG